MIPTNFIPRAPIHLIRPSGQIFAYGHGSNSDTERGTALVAAMTAALAGDIVVCWNDATVAAPLGKHGVRLHVPSALIRTSTGHLFSDGGLATTFTVTGNGTFVNNGNFSVIRTSHASSSFTIFGRTVSSIATSVAAVNVVTGNVSLELTEFIDIAPFTGITIAAGTLNAKCRTIIADICVSPSGGTLDIECRDLAYDTIGVDATGGTTNIYSHSVKSSDVSVSGGTVNIKVPDVAINQTDANLTNNIAGRVSIGGGTGVRKLHVRSTTNDVALFESDNGNCSFLLLNNRGGVDAVPNTQAGRLEFTARHGGFVDREIARIAGIYQGDGTTRKGDLTFAVSPVDGPPQEYARLSSDLQFRIGSTTSLGWTSTVSPTGTPDLFLHRDAANTLAQRNGTNAQAFHLYNTFISSSDYERAIFGWSSNEFVLSTGIAGTGVARRLRIDSAINNQSMLRQRNAGNTAFIDLPYITTNDRLLVPTSAHFNGPTPTTTPHPNRFVVIQPTSLDASGVMLAAFAPTTTGAIDAFNFEGSVTTDLIGRIANTNTATSTANSKLHLRTGNPASGDPFIHFQVVSGSQWTFGIDNSATNDPLRISKSSIVGTNVAVTFNDDLSVDFPFGVLVGASTGIRPSTGTNILLRDSAGTGFNLLQLGGTTNAFPALKRSSTTLQVRLADDSGYAPLEASTAKVVQGTSTSLAKAGGTLAGLPNVTQVGNVGGGEDDLITYSIAANTLATNGDMVEFEGTFRNTDGDNGSSFKWYFGSTMIQQFFTVLDFESYHFHLSIIRLSSTVARWMLRLTDPLDNLGGNSWVGELTSQDFTVANTFKMTGQHEAVSPVNDTATQRYLAGWYWPAN